VEHHPRIEFQRHLQDLLDDAYLVLFVAVPCLLFQCCYGTTTKSTCYFYLAEGSAAAQKHGEDGANKNNGNETAKDEEEVWQGASFLDDQDSILLPCDLYSGVRCLFVQSSNDKSNTVNALSATASSSNISSSNNKLQIQTLLFDCFT
jgi:hypothetical protein